MASIYWVVTVRVFLVTAILCLAESAFSSDKIPDYVTNLCPSKTPCIAKHRKALSFERGVLDKLPRFDPADTENPFQVDLRGYDVSKLKIAGRAFDLFHSAFDSKTIWPTVLPSDFDPLKLAEIAKNPGLGVRKLHQRGITGKGVGIGIIDQALLVDHVEYKDRTMLYEEIHLVDKAAAMHGGAVASIAAGKTIGVAPQASLYFIAETHWNDALQGGRGGMDLQYLAKSIDRLVEINKLLPAKDKIRVISISLGTDPKWEGLELERQAVARAKQQGIYVVSVGSDPFLGLGRLPLADPEDVRSYRRGHFWSNNLYENDKILIPMDARTTASPTGTSDYVFYYQGGMSWTVPWVAGLYALACQVKTDMTPELFWDYLFKTSLTVEIADEQYPRLGKVVNPVALIEAIQKLQ